MGGAALWWRRLLWAVLAGGLLLFWAWTAWYQARWHTYEELIAAAAAEYEVPADLIAALIWQESRFRPDVVGGVGEIGLMQVTPLVGYEWAGRHDHHAFDPDELFDPVTNIRVGTWYLARALAQWSDRPDAVPYALAQYNAGRRNALRWAQDDQNDPEQFIASITYPTTRHYVRSILNRYR